jgi:NAD-dependent SIR2 family protein deacetylase
MVYVTVCLDLALFKMKEHDNECVKYNCTMPRKAKCGVFCSAEVLRSDVVKFGAQFPMFRPIAAELSTNDSAVSHTTTPEYR